MKYLILIVAPLLIFSCKKDEVEVTEPTPAKEVYAGNHDSTFDYYEYQPSVGISIVWDTQHLYGIGNDSIDLDLNGTYDLFIALNVLNIDSAYMLGGALPDPFPNCTLSTSSEFEVAFYTDSYPIGMGQTSSISYVDRLDMNEQINLLTDWRGGGKMWQQNPGWGGTPPYGDWASAGTSNYIAVKKNNKYGWVEIDASNDENVQFKRYAISH